MGISNDAQNVLYCLWHLLIISFTFIQFSLNSNIHFTINCTSINHQFIVFKVKFKSLYQDGLSALQLGCPVLSHITTWGKYSLNSLSVFIAFKKLIKSSILQLKVLEIFLALVRSQSFLVSQS